jgi:hypothetical protein
VKNLNHAQWQNPLFKETITVSELRGSRGNEILTNVTGDTVVRVLHRDKAIKVVITEDFFLTLLSVYEADKDENPANTPMEVLVRQGIEELKTMMGKFERDGDAQNETGGLSKASGSHE